MYAGVKRKIEECWKHIKNYLDKIDDFPELKAMCDQCEVYCGKEHDYVECRENPCFICWLALEYLEWSDGYE